MSALFLYMGMLPDLALLARRVGGWRRPLYRVLSLGFSGTDGEWRLFEKAYPIFAGRRDPARRLRPQRRVVGLRDDA